MIRVVRIVGEAFDIETGQETSKAIVLSNGKDELHVPVRDDVINAILHMYWHAPEQTKAAEPQPPPPEVVVEAMDEPISGPFDDPRSGTASI